MNYPMMTLQESLFDGYLIKKDILNDTGFKKWINQPNTLWYIYYYWESGEEDWLSDFMRDDWKIYKPMVDWLLDELKDCIWRMINFDMYDYEDSIKDKFASEDEFWDMMGDAIDEILKKSTDKKDGIAKTWFRGGFPKNSNVTALLQQLEFKFANPGYVSGGILLTNEDTIIVMAFPKGTPQNILKLFNIK